MITREGMETALLIATAFFQLKSVAVVAGLALGLLGAAAIGILWTRLGKDVDLKTILNVSAVFLAIFLLQLVLYGVHELSEARLFPASQAIHDATEILGPDGVIGHLLAYALAVIPTVWLAALWWKRRRAARVAAAPPSRQRGVGAGVGGARASAPCPTRSIASITASETPAARSFWISGVVSEYGLCSLSDLREQLRVGRAVLLRREDLGIRALARRRRRPGVGLLRHDRRRAGRRAGGGSFSEIAARVLAGSAVLAVRALAVGGVREMNQVLPLRHVDVFALDLDPVAERERDRVAAAGQIVHDAHAPARVEREVRRRRPRLARASGLARSRVGSRTRGTSGGSCGSSAAPFRRALADDLDEGALFEAWSGRRRRPRRRRTTRPAGGARTRPAKVSLHPRIIAEPLQTRGLRGGSGAADFGA